MRKLNIIGQRFNNCVVTKEKGCNLLGKSVWECLCDCGIIFQALGTELKSGHTKSCGCYSRTGTFTFKHGYRSGAGKQHPMYTLWINMKDRCTNPNNPHFEDYGGRGITVCEEWLNSFEIFKNDIHSTIGEKPPNVKGYKRYWSLDRIDNNHNYTLGNVRWSDPATQKLNQRKRRWYKRLMPVEI